MTIPQRELTCMRRKESVCSRLPQITHQPWAHLGPTESSIARRRFKGDSGAIQGRFDVFYSDSAFQHLFSRGRRHKCKAIRVSPPTPFIILKKDEGRSHTLSSSCLAVGRMVLKFYKAHVSNSSKDRSICRPGSSSSLSLAPTRAKMAQ